MKSSLIIVLIFLLQGCALFGKQDTVTIVEPEEFVIIHPTQPDETVMREVKWRVLSRKDLEKMMETDEGRKDLIDAIFKQDLALYVLNTEGYENLSLNMQEIIRYMKQQKEIIIYYREQVPSAKDTEESKEKKKET